MSLDLALSGPHNEETRLREIWYCRLRHPHADCDEPIAFTMATVSGERPHSTLWAAGDLLRLAEASALPGGSGTHRSRSITPRSSASSQRFLPPTHRSADGRRATVSVLGDFRLPMAALSGDDPLRRESHSARRIKSLRDAFSSAETAVNETAEDEPSENSSMQDSFSDNALVSRKRSDLPRPTSRLTRRLSESPRNSAEAYRLSQSPRAATMIDLLERPTQPSGFSLSTPLNRPAVIDEEPKPKPSKSTPLPRNALSPIRKLPGRLSRHYESSLSPHGSFRHKHLALLIAVLHHHKALDSLLCFVRREHSEENVEFLLSVIEFRKKYNADHKELASHKLIVRATDIFNKFVARDAPSLVNLPAETAAFLKGTFSKDSGCYPKHINQWVFDQAYQDCISLVCQDIFWRYLEEPEHLAVCVKALSKFGDKLAYFE